MENNRQAQRESAPTLLGKSHHTVSRFSILRIFSKSPSWSQSDTSVQGNLKAPKSLSFFVSTSATPSCPRALPVVVNSDVRSGARDAQAPGVGTGETDKRVRGNILHSKDSDAMGNHVSETLHIYVELLIVSRS